MKAVVIPLRQPLRRGERRLRIALVGLRGAGAHAIFQAIEGTRREPNECDVDIGLDQARVALVIVPSADALPDLGGADVVVQVVDATDLERHLALTLALQRLGAPLVVAVNKMDAARAQGLHIAAKVLSRCLQAPVVGTIGTMGYRIRDLFAAAVEQAGRGPSAVTEMTARVLAEIAARPAGVRSRHDWRFWLDELLLSRRFGLVGSAAVFGTVLFVVFDLSARIDAFTTAPLAQWVSSWTPQTTGDVILRAVADGLVGLVGIVVPYMIPLVLLLVALEQAGIMARVAFAADRFFHSVGLHGDVALPLLLGLGCNVPALSAIGTGTRGRSRTVASVLATFVPCSARSAIILAVAGKYLGAWGVLAVFGFCALVIVILGRFLQRKAAGGLPGHIQDIPPYARPRARALVRETWLRTRDILTIVTPLLVGGSVVLALLDHFGGASMVNAVLAPLTTGWLGLPAVLGVPLLFGVLRKELSLAMIYQALGGFDISAYLDRVQIFTFLVFLTLYVPCVSAFAVLAKNLGMRQAVYAAGLSFGVALAASGAARLLLQL
jgi:Fe2+ transport system protein B